MPDSEWMETASGLYLRIGDDRLSLLRATHDQKSWRWFVEYAGKEIGSLPAGDQMSQTQLSALALAQDHFLKLYDECGIAAKRFRVFQG